MLNAVNGFLQIPALTQEEIAWHKRWLNSILTLFAVISAMLLLLVPFYEDFSPVQQWTATAVYVTVILLSLGGVIVGRRVPPWSVALPIVLLLYGAVTSTLLIFWGERGIFSVAYMLPVIMTALFLGRRTLSGLTLLIIITTLIVLFASAREWYDALTAPDLSVVYEVSVTLAIVGFSSMMLRSYLGGKERQLKQLQQEVERHERLLAGLSLIVWEADMSRVYADLLTLKEMGITDLQAHFGSYPDRFYACVQKAELIRLNEAGLQLLGVEDEETLMGAVEQFLPEDLMKDMVKGLEAIQAGKRRREGEITLYGLDGELVHLLVKWQVDEEAEEPYGRLVGSMTDITHFKASLSDALQKENQWQTLRRMDLDLLGAQRPAEAAEAALTHLRSLLPGVEMSVWQTPPQPEHLLLLAHLTDTGEMTVAASPRPLPLPILPVWHRLQQRETVTTRKIGVAYGLPLREDAEELRQAVLSVPLLDGKELIGVWALAVQSEGRLTAVNAAEIVQQAAPSLARALQNTRRQAEARRRQEQANALRHVALLPSESQDEKRTLEMILLHLSRYMEVSSAAILLLTNNGRNLRVGASYNISPTVRAVIQGEIHSWPSVQQVLQEKRSVLIPNTYQWTESWRLLPGLEHIRCWLGVPLLVGDQLLGLLSIDHKQPGFFTESDRVMGMTFANQAARVVHQVQQMAQLRREMQQQVHRVRQFESGLEAVAEMTAVAVRHADLEPLLQKALLVTLSAMESEAGTLHFKTAVDAPLRLVAHRGIDPALADQLAAWHEGNLPFRRIFREKTAVLLEAGELFPLPDELPAHALGMYLGAPIWVKGEILGVLSVYSSVADALLVEEVAALTIIAEQVGAAAEIHRLRRQVREAAVAAERDRLARDLHDSVTQSLYGLTTLAESMKNRVHTDERVQKDVSLIAKYGWQALQEMRQMLYELQSPALSKKDLVSALKERLDRVERHSPIRVALTADELPALPASVKEAFFWVTQEALANAAKHANATAVAVHLTCVGEEIWLTITDDGDGFDVEAARTGGGLGLKTMQSRVEEIGGVLEIVSRVGEGTKLAATAVWSKSIGE